MKICLTPLPYPWSFISQYILGKGKKKIHFSTIDVTVQIAFHCTNTYHFTVQISQSRESGHRNMQALVQTNHKKALRKS